MYMPNKYLLITMAFSGLAALAATGCASTPSNLSGKIPFEKDAIQFHFRADSMLNLYEDEAHTLVLCLYQLNNAEVFREMTKSQEGVVRLLSCTSFGDSVLAFQRIIVHPGEIRTLTMDRAEGTQFVGAVAGYFESSPDKSSQLYGIPIGLYEEGFWMWKKRYRWPNDLEVTLYLDPKGLRANKDKREKVSSERS